LLEALRSARSAQRRRKKERSRANRSMPLLQPQQQQPSCDTKDDSTLDDVAVGTATESSAMRPETEISVTTPRPGGNGQLLALQSNNPVVERPWKLQCTGNNRGGGETVRPHPSAVPRDPHWIRDPCRSDPDGIDGWKWISDEDLERMNAIVAAGPPPRRQR